MIRRTLMATALLAAASATIAGPAAAATGGTSAAAAPKTFARLAGPVVADASNPEIGYVTAVYRCYGEGRLWVSAKQVADRSRDPRLQQPESSQVAAAWSDSHFNTVTCDGRTRLQVFSVNQDEPLWGSDDPKSAVYEPLAKGWAWVQFCLFDDNNTQEPYSENAFRPVLAKR